MFGDSSIFRHEYVLSRLTLVSIHIVHARKGPTVLETLLPPKDCFCNIPHLNVSIKLSYQWGLNTVSLSYFVVRLRFEVTMLKRKKNYTKETGEKSSNQDGKKKKSLILFDLI